MQEKLYLKNCPFRPQKGCFMAIKHRLKDFQSRLKTTRAETISYSASFLCNSSSYLLFSVHFHSLDEFVVLFKAD